SSERRTRTAPPSRLHVAAPAGAARRPSGRKDPCASKALPISVSTWWPRAPVLCGFGCRAPTLCVRQFPDGEALAATVPAGTRTDGALLSLARLPVPPSSRLLLPSYVGRSGRSVLRNGAGTRVLGGVVVATCPGRMDQGRIESGRRQRRPDIRVALL